MMLEKIALKIVVALAAMIVCFAVGYDLGSDRQKAKQIDAVVQAQADSKNEVLASQAKSVAIESSAAASTQTIKSLSDQAVKRVENNEPKVITKTVTVYKCPGETNVNSDDSTTELPTSVVEVSRPWTFDNGTVRLLNSARADDTDSTASVSNVADQTPTDVTVGKFVENDLEVVSLYHDQSVRFKALQDYVKEKQDEGYMFCKPP